MRCSECAFVEHAVMESGPVYECRRFPPTVFTLDETAYRTWPHMNANDWCGEFRHWSEQKLGEQILNLPNRGD